VAQVVEATQGLDARSLLRRLPVPAAEAAEVDPAASRIREQDLVRRLDKQGQHPRLVASDYRRNRRAAGGDSGGRGASMAAIRVLRASLVAATLVVTTATASASEASSNGSLAVVRWGLFKNYNPVYVANDEGFFRRQKIEIEFTGTFNSGPQVVAAAATGAVDAGHSAISGIANAVAAGIQVQGVADSQTEFRNAPLMQWFVLSGSPIRTGRDLKGRTIGVNSLAGSFYYTVLLYLHRNGLDKSDVHFAVIPHQNQEQALRSRQIDVAGLIDPYSIHIKDQGGVRVLFRGVDVIGQRQFSLIFFTRKYIHDHPQVVRRFVRAYQQAVAYIARHPRNASRIAARYIGVEAKLTGIHRYTAYAHVKMADVQFWLDLMRQEGELRDDGRIHASDVATTRFARAPPRPHRAPR
jgi:ABC-type nitrate/sulfonate/bicarbonate transport system substrate-binding protein